MSFNTSFLKKPKAKSETAVVMVGEKKRLSASAEALDKKAKGLIKQALENNKSFKEDNGNTLCVYLPSGSDFSKVILVSLGKADDLNTLAFETVGGKLFGALKACSAEHVSIFVDSEIVSDDVSVNEAAAKILNGIKLSSYRFDKYKNTQKNKESDDTPSLKEINVIMGTHTAASRLYDKYASVTEGVFLARDLMNEPANQLYPESYAEKIKEELKPLGVEIEIFDEKKMQKLGFHAHYEVGKGSDRQPRVVVMRWNGKASTGKKSDTPLALVGKGVTFDTGGISLKPGAGMEDMKMDMGGSAAVVGLMKALALREAKTSVIGIVGLAENMPSSGSYRPGDVIQSMSGKTVEVINTDAEGRLVLIDSLTYVQKKYAPKAIIDLATLTGAIMVALGQEYSGAFVNKDDLWTGLEKASKVTGEKLWRMPLDEAYRKALESKVADINHLGNLGRYGGACTAAAFLESFIEGDTAWAHLDIAGKMMQKSDKPLTPSGGVGFGVRLLNQFIEDKYA